MLLVRGWCWDCWGLEVCRWGFLRRIWVLAKTPGVSGSWFSLLYQGFLCSKPASLSEVCQVHPSQRSQRSNNHPWRRCPGRFRHWTCVPRTRKKSVTDVYKSHSRFHDQVAGANHKLCLFEGNSQVNGTTDGLNKLFRHVVFFPKPISVSKATWIYVPYQLHLHKREVILSFPNIKNTVRASETAQSVKART